MSSADKPKVAAGEVVTDAAGHRWWRRATLTPFRRPDTRLRRSRATSHLRIEHYVEPYSKDDDDDAWPEEFRDGGPDGPTFPQQRLATEAEELGHAVADEWEDVSNAADADASSDGEERAPDEEDAERGSGEEHEDDVGGGVAENDDQEASIGDAADVEHAEEEDEGVHAAEDASETRSNADEEEHEHGVYAQEDEQAAQEEYEEQEEHEEEEEYEEAEEYEEEEEHEEQDHEEQDGADEEECAQQDENGEQDEDEQEEAEDDEEEREVEEGEQEEEPDDDSIEPEALLGFNDFAYADVPEAVERGRAWIRSHLPHLRWQD